MINSETHVFRVGKKWKLMVGAFIVAALAQWFLAYDSFTRYMGTPHMNLLLLGRALLKLSCARASVLRWCGSIGLRLCT